jgi:3-methyladenine DNA glycosylase AlkD
MDKDRIRFETKKIFRDSRSENLKDYAKADLIKKLLSNCYIDDENEFVNDEDNKTLNFNRSNFDTIRFVGKEIKKLIRTQSIEHIQLAKILWDRYGKEGKLISIYILSQIMSENPKHSLTFIYEIAKKCTYKEDCDNLAIKVIEPTFISQIEIYYDVLDKWIKDESKWIRRIAVTILGRIPKKKPEYTKKCLNILSTCLYDKDTDVIKSVSFALKLITHGNLEDVKKYLINNIGENNNSKIWIFSDFILNLKGNTLTSLNSLYSYYLEWYNNINEEQKKVLKPALNLLEQVN